VRKSAVRQQGERDASDGADRDQQKQYSDAMHAPARRREFGAVPEIFAPCYQHTDPAYGMADPAVDCVWKSESRLKEKRGESEFSEHAKSTTREQRKVHDYHASR
jgi:hypothetical protein